MGPQIFLCQLYLAHFLIISRFSIKSLPINEHIISPCISAKTFKAFKVKVAIGWKLSVKNTLYFNLINMPLIWRADIM